MAEIKLNSNLPAASMNSIKQGPLADKKNPVTEQKFREVAEMYEKHFIREMMKEMQATVHESGFIKKNNAEKIFQDQLDDHYAGQWGQKGGIGLADLIHGQLMQKYGAQYGLKEKAVKPEGPIDFNLKSNITTIRVPAVVKSSAADVTQLKIQPEAGDGSKASALKNPWAGTLLDKKYLEMDQMQYRIKHDNGLESLIMTRGTGLVEPAVGDKKVSLGDAIGAGEQLGWLDSSSPLFWTIKPSVSE